MDSLVKVSAIDTFTVIRTISDVCIKSVAVTIATPLPLLGQLVICVLECSCYYSNTFTVIRTISDMCIRV